jgi:hypothetical protein
MEIVKSVYSIHDMNKLIKYVRHICVYQSSSIDFILAYVRHTSCNLLDPLLVAIF